MAEFRSILRPDVGFHLYAARQVLDGARLYVDLVEINPPLIVGINLVAVAVAGALGLPPAHVYRAGVLLLAGASLWISGSLSRRLLPDERDLQHALMLLTGLVLLPMPAEDLGQREYLALALVLPYIWLVAMRVRGVALRAGGAAALGLFSGIGFALKPHFLLAWVALELYRRRSAGRLSAATPESTAVLFVLWAYSLFVLVVTPGYLVLAATLAPAYARFLERPVTELLSGVAGALNLLAFLGYVALRPRARNREVWDVLLVSGLAFFLGGVLQGKGLSYHFYPSLALATILLGVLGLDVRQPLLRPSERIYRVVATATVVTIGIVALTRSAVTAARAGQAYQPEAGFERLVEVVRREAAGDAVFMFSYNIRSTFPLVNYAGVRSASRFPHLWILAAEYVERLRAAAPLEYRGWNEMDTAERFLNQAVLADLRAARPRLLLVYRNARDDPANGLRRFDYLAYFGRDPRFRDIFTRYELFDRIGEYVLYRRLGEAERRGGPMPTAAPGKLDVERVGGVTVREPRIGWDVFAMAAVFFIAVALLAWREIRSARPPELSRP